MSEAIIYIYIMYNKIGKKLQKIGIFGLSKTGRSVFEYFNNHQNQLICYDDKPVSIDAFIDEYGAEFIRDLDSEEWRCLDQIVVSPGITSTHPIFMLASKYDISISNDIDIFYEQNKQALFVAVTGTNGKSTSTALIAHILQVNGVDFAFGGNIGTPVLSLPQGKKIYVLELSSFQLDLLKKFKANIVVLLNITSDHLDRYHTMENYINSKKKIFALINCQNNSPCRTIICTDHTILKDIYEDLSKTSSLPLIPISSQKKLNEGVTCLAGRIEDNINQDDCFTTSYKQGNNLQGLHNQENIAASYAVCRILSLNSEQIIKALESFESLPHRMQYLGNINNIDFYNDSKATNADSAGMSLKSLDNIFWLAGGVLKEGGIVSLEPYFKNIKKAYFYGSNQQVFADQFKNFGKFIICQNLSTAFKYALEEASKTTSKVNILLSPASASYDQYKNFEERGEHFIRLFKTVKQLYERIPTT